MASLVGGSASAQRAGPGKGLPDMEDEDDLFEIDLDSVDSIPQTQYYWKSYFTETGNALLANCLLPVTDISRAIPMVSKAMSSSERTGNVVMIPQAVPLGQLLGLPFLEAFGLHQKEMKQMCNPIRKTEAHLDVGPEPLEGRYRFVYGR
ncbi:hypothetical protein C1H46_030044 [Malus baccata]|uniref:Uncharacterized protein n=1 Tax=Malus baccata TaxID=106549 RepID=A0A540LDF6_MALBA|nr:hypothetical protein C1H46_030044 [Malus baccata]